MANDNQIPDEPINKTPFTPLGVENSGKKNDSVPQILRRLMKRYDDKLVSLKDFTNFSDDILIDPVKYMHAAAGRKQAINFVKSEKSYLQTQIDRLSSKQ